MACSVRAADPPAPPDSAWPELPSEGSVRIDLGGGATQVHTVRMGFLSAVKADGITRGAKGSSILLTLVNSSSEEKPVIVLSRYQRVLLEPREGGLALQTDGAIGGNIAPSAEAVVRITATGVGDPEEPGEIIEIHSPSLTARIDAWIVPLLGEWRGAGRDGEDLDLGMIAFHAALMRNGDSGQVVFYSPPRERRSDGSFKRRPFGSTRAGGYYWQLSTLNDVEIALWDIASGEVRKRPMTEPHNLFCSGHAHLPDGRLLVVGGHVGLFPNNADSIHVFDANVSAGWWTRLSQQIPETRWYPTVTALPDGKMLIASGRGAALLGNLLDQILGWYRTPRKTYLIFDPRSSTLASGTFIDDDKLATYPTVVALPGGSEHPGGVVFAQERNNAWLFGYEGQDGGRLTLRSQVYKMATQGSRSYPYYGSAAILPFDALNPGKFRILIVAGQGEGNPNHEDYDVEQPATRTAEKFDFDNSLSLTAQAGWRRIQSMTHARLFPNTTVPSGRDSRKLTAAALEVRPKVGAQVASVIGCAVDEGRLPAPQKRQAHEVHAGGLDDAAIVTDMALAVDYRHVKPGIVGTEAGCPEDGRDPGAGDVDSELRRSFDFRRLDAMRWLHLAVESVRGRPFVDPVEEPVHLEIREGALVPKRSRELRLAVPKPRETAHELHADSGERIEIEGTAFRAARELKGVHVPSPNDVVHLVVTLVENPCRVHPPLDVAPPIDAGDSNVLAHGEGDRPARAMDLVGDLSPRGRGAHDEHTTVLEL